jgi:phospholipase A1
MDGEKGMDGLKTEKRIHGWLIPLIALILLVTESVSAQETSELEEETKADEEIKVLLETLEEYRNRLRSSLEKYGKKAEDFEFDYRETQLEKRLKQERDTENNLFSFAPHQRNYILPVSYSTHPNQQRFDYLDSERDLQSTEIKFQLSIKVPLLQQWASDRQSLHFAYTQTSWWQAYHSEASRPFRESNYEPEFFFTQQSDLQFLGLSNPYNRLGFAHQSNGRTDPQSRSWNYIYASTVLAKGNWMLEFSPRYKLPRFTGEDDNPDLENYIGYFDLSLAYANWGQEFVVTTQGNFETEQGGLQLDWSFPLYGGKLRGLVQAYAGYGESLIDYDHENYRFSIGFQFTNQLFGDF